MKRFAKGAAIVFVLFAAVQYNDPDPWLWAPVYLYAAVVSWLMGRGTIVSPAIIGGMLAYFVGALYLFTPDVLSPWLEAEMSNQTADMKTPTMEEGREFWGLVICFLVMVAYMFQAVNKRKIQIG